LTEKDGKISYVLTVQHYDKLRSVDIAAPRVLVLLRLPPKPEEWLEITEDALVAKRCAYWMSLRGATASENQKNQTVYIPRMNLLSLEGLTSLMTRFSRQEVIPYDV
jgi:hypothetical protein